MPHRPYHAPTTPLSSPYHSPTTPLTRPYHAPNTPLTHHYHAPFQGGTTNTYDAARMIREDILTPAKGDRRSAPNVVLLMTDGEYTNTTKITTKDYHEEMRKLKNVGEKVRWRQLDEMGWLGWSEIRRVEYLWDTGL